MKNIIFFSRSNQIRYLWISKPARIQEISIEVEENEDMTWNRATPMLLEQQQQKWCCSVVVAATPLVQFFFLCFAAATVAQATWCQQKIAASSSSSPFFFLHSSSSTSSPTLRPDQSKPHLINGGSIECNLSFLRFRVCPGLCIIEQTWSGREGFRSKSI